MAYNNKIVTNSTGSTIDFATTLKQGQLKNHLNVSATRSSPFHSKDDYYTNIFIQTNLQTNNLKDDAGESLPVYLSSDGSLYSGYFYLTATGDFFTGKWPGSNVEGNDTNVTDFSSLGKSPSTKSDILLLPTSDLSATLPPVGRDPIAHTPRPDHLDYIQDGTMFRHFAKKRNESTTKAYREIAASDYQLLIDRDPKINFRDWDTRRVRWRIGSLNPFVTYVENKNIIFDLGRGTYNPTKDSAFNLSTGNKQLITPAKLAKLYTLNSVAFNSTEIEMLRRGDTDELANPLARQYQPPWPGFKEFFAPNFVDESYIIRNKNPKTPDLSTSRLWVPSRIGSRSSLHKAADFKYFTEFWVDVFNDTTPIAFNPITSKIDLSKGPLFDPGYPFKQRGNPYFRINVKKSKFDNGEGAYYRSELILANASAGFNEAQIKISPMYHTLADFNQRSPYATSTYGIFLRTTVEPYASKARFYEANLNGTPKLVNGQPKQYSGTFHMTYKNAPAFELAFRDRGTRFYKGNVPTYSFDSMDSKRNTSGKGSIQRLYIKWN